MKQSDQPSENTQQVHETLRYNVANGKQRQTDGQGETDEQTDSGRKADRWTD